MGEPAHEAIHEAIQEPAHEPTHAAAPAGLPAWLDADPAEEPEPAQATEEWPRHALLAEPGTGADARTGTGVGADTVLGNGTAAVHAWADDADPHADPFANPAGEARHRPHPQDVDHWAGPAVFAEPLTDGLPRARADAGLWADPIPDRESHAGGSTAADPWAGPAVHPEGMQLRGHSVPFEQSVPFDETEPFEETEPFDRADPYEWSASFEGRGPSERHKAAGHAETAPTADPAGPGGKGSAAAIASSVADQGVAAFTNIIVLVVAARLSSAAAFSVFSMVYMVFTVLLGVNVSYVGQALVLERGSERVRAACRSAVAFTATASALLGWSMAAVLAFTGGTTAHGLAVLGAVLPIVLTQDGMRYCFSALRLPHLALVADTVRLLVAVPALAVQPQGTGAVRLVGVWGLSGLPALLVAALLLRPRLKGAPVDILPYVRRGHLGQRFVVEFGVGNATSQLAVVGLGLFAAPLAVGALRGATTLFGPMNVLFNSATAFGPPLLNRVRGTTAKVRATVVLAAALAGTAVAWTAVLMLLPAHAGRQLLGATWSASSALLPASGSQYACIALGTSALLTLRVLQPRATLPIQVAFSLTSVVLMLLGYHLDGVLGAAWGLALGSLLKAAALWLRISREQSRSQ